MNQFLWKTKSAVSIAYVPLLASLGSLGFKYERSKEVLRPLYQMKGSEAMRRAKEYVCLKLVDLDKIYNFVKNAELITNRFGNLWEISWNLETMRRTKE